MDLDNDGDRMKNLLLFEELNTSVKLIRLGFGELQNLNASNDFYFLPFQLLSQGFERFMKSYLCLSHLHQNSKFPKYIFLKEIGHDLEKNLREILTNHFQVDERIVLKEDSDFLNTNSELKELLFLLSEFGKLSRYYNFDVITDNAKVGINVKDRWLHFENQILAARPNSLKKLLDLELHDELYGEISKVIVILLEKFVSALARQFIFNTLGSKGKQFSSVVMDFGMLYEKDFGNTNYREYTSSYSFQKRKPHRRNFRDWIDRKYNKNYKSKKMSKELYEGEWPFYANEVIIECRYKYWCIVTIGNYDYALNGSAKGKYKLENTHDAGMAILGKTTSGFIQMALELWR